MQLVGLVEHACFSEMRGRSLQRSRIYDEIMQASVAACRTCTLGEVSVDVAQVDVAASEVAATRDLKERHRHRKRSQADARVL